MLASENVRIDPGSTALHMLDFDKQTCNAEHRHALHRSLSKVQKLVTEAKAKHVAVIYMSVGAVTADIAKEVAYQERKDVVT